MDSTGHGDRPGWVEGLRILHPPIAGGPNGSRCQIEGDGGPGSLAGHGAALTRRTEALDRGSSGPSRVPRSDGRSIGNGRDLDRRDAPRVR